MYNLVDAVVEAVLEGAGGVGGPVVVRGLVIALLIGLGLLSIGLCIEP
jgi:hypothetical protein